MKCRLAVAIPSAVAILFILPCLPQPQSLRYKGIWEPVNYNADVKLLDVFFATADEGWAAGGTTEIRGGLILHTSDGGSHWEVEYGDPQSSDRAVRNLRFFDSMHGWAMQGTGSATHLLHTADGHNWNLAGTIPEGTTDYMFVSEANGVAVQSSHVLKTGDGGRSWRPAAECETTVQINGLSRRIRCEWSRLQFVNASTAYAIGFNRQAKDLVILAKTSDAGGSWNLVSAPVTDTPQDAFFLDESTGYIRTGAPDTGQIFKTGDGGQTWMGMGASPGARILFADPEVGWAVLNNKVSFTTDSGGHWNSRQYGFPARVNAFALPRRDRGYVAGEHGMIYRYRLVPEDYTAPGVIAAPLLSGIESPLDQQMVVLASQIQRLAQDAGIPPQQAAAAVNPPPPFATGTDAASAGAAGFAQDTSTANSAAQNAGAVNGGFVQDTTQAATTLDAMAGAAPQFISKYRNLNLLMAGVQMTAQMPQQLQSLKQALFNLKQAGNPQAATTSVQSILTQVGGLRQSVRMAFQKPRL